MDKLFSTIQQSFNQINKDDKKQSLLQRQQLSQDKINDLLEQSSQAILCGPNCQKLKIEKTLKQKYLDSQTNLQTAPIKLEQDKKNYYVYTEGSTYYDNIQEKELNIKADNISQLIEENFNNELTSANTMNTYLNTALINSSHTTELFEEYLEKNNALKLALRDKRGDILTNDRKTYYETEALDNIKLWYSLFWYIYYLLVIVLFLALILSPTELTIVKRIVVFVLVFAYPYYIDYIVRFIYGIYISITKRLPKNVYNDL